ncbi:DeoR/GlpR family DNA-binding transcription regulator [Anaerocolumna xylanovorans]|uniref:Transcriptional regulator, DeoR family n=1 Tax=Anaerocolumna xylanovorans DSM 12503 TaxID=1121345 RepID=A0A1M7Y568_9FIRM|nr:DeoR/GlpR family DNA-binding transcription regulator [Anaerocolumna xylanovorans]SHO47549.1 transcriptional regulator, DeoR family [Anaerocolumna xylanovorans DSM 12503]
MNNKVEIRRKEITKLIRDEGEVTVTDMANRFGVTMETIRGDFDYLAEQEGFVRGHGNLSRQEKKKYKEHYLFHERQLLQKEEKKQICKRAAEMIADGDSIYLDSGSTVTYLLPGLTDKKGLTVVTNSIACLFCYIMEGYHEAFREQGHRFLFLGGEVEPNIRMTYGTFFEQCVEEISYDYLFFSADALDMEFGCSNVDYQAYSAIKPVFRQVRNKILLADSSKFNLKAAYRVAGWKEIDCLIMAGELKEDWRLFLESRHITYYQV